MSEIEVPLEASQDHILEHAKEAGQTPHGRWLNWVALSSALLAVVAAIAALMAGHLSNEALLEQIQASDHWAYFQAKGIKSAILQSKVQLLEGLGRKPETFDLNKIESYKKEQDELTEKAKEKETSSLRHLELHQIFAEAVTFFQIAIATSAIAVLIRRRRFWMMSMLVGVVGLMYFIQGLWLLR